MNPRSTDCEADALTTTPSRRSSPTIIIFADCRQIGGDKFKLITGSKAFRLKFVVISLLVLAYCSDTSGRFAVAFD